MLSDDRYRAYEGWLRERNERGWAGAELLENATADG